MTNVVTRTADPVAFEVQASVDSQQSVSGAAPSSDTLAAGDLTSFSPDSLLAYCQGRLGDLDTQINAAMNQQNDGIQERQAIQQAVSAMSQFNPGGPQTPAQMQTCVSAVNTALQSFPPGDPEGAQLQSALQQMESDYQYTPPGSLPPDQQALLDKDLQSGSSPDPLQSGAMTIMDLQSLQQSGQLKAPPSSDQWTATMSSFSNVSSDIQSQSEIGFLQMQDLVSQRQQAIELSTGLMNKVDQTLEDQAKAVGQ
jgi:hypothetical protein